MSDSAGTRYTTLTATDQSANIWVVSIITICVSTACFAVRAFSKSRTAFKFGFDDYSLIGGWCLSIVHTALIIRSLTLGLGKDGSIVPAENVASMEKYFFASIVFGILSLYSVKISMILLIQRLFRKSMLPVWIAFTILGITSGITAMAGCSYRHCSNFLARWVIVAVFDILTETVIILLPVFCIRSIQMPRAGKLKVQASFFSRLSNVLFSSLTIWSISRLELPSRSTTLIALPVVLGQLDICVSLSIASVLPCFRIIFQSSEKIPTEFSTNAYQSEPKPDRESSLRSPVQDSFGLGSVNHLASGTFPSAQIPGHSPVCRDDLVTAHSSHSGSAGRLSSTSIALSGATGLSQKFLIM
ncbi:hypothetical protein FKW77_009728 [Venturia effusa]|uniref:Rhodopsin domain-containing protein n=1 Tax=Venturia effusa TaxID=50376 RepID=A0A517LEN8_9PEZI|nr:hypothetical protein FKW77_009728 [Venturia effusa]